MVHAESTLQSPELASGRDLNRRPELVTGADFYAAVDARLGLLGRCASYQSSVFSRGARAFLRCRRSPSPIKAIGHKTAILEGYGPTEANRPFRLNL